MSSADLEERSRVLIVGAGPAGAATALLLASRGVPVTLIERQSDFDREFRGEVVMPGGRRVLEQMGLTEAVRELPHQQPSRVVVFVEGKRVLELGLDLPIFGDLPPISLSQPHLLEMLVERASGEPGFVFHRRGVVRDLLEEQGRVVGVRAQLESGERELRADLVIGTDGRSSIVRRRGGYAWESADLPMDVVWCKLPMPETWASRKDFQAYVAEGHLLILLPAPDGRLQVGWVILKGRYRDLRESGFPGWITHMADLVEPAIRQHFLAHAEDAMRPFVLDAQADRVHGWSRPGVLLLGDAAHTMSPVGAQGINVALRDAVVAANHLVEPLRAGASPEAIDVAAARIEAERGPDIDAIQELAAQPPRLVLAPGRRGAMLRSLLPWVARIPGVTRLALGQARVFTQGTTTVELRV